MGTFEAFWGVCRSCCHDYKRIVSRKALKIVKWNSVVQQSKRELSHLTQDFRESMNQFIWPCRNSMKLAARFLTIKEGLFYIRDRRFSHVELRLEQAFLCTSAAQSSQSSWSAAWQQKRGRTQVLGYHPGASAPWHFVVDGPWCGILAVWVIVTSLVISCRMIQGYTGIPLALAVACLGQVPRTVHGGLNHGCRCLPDLSSPENPSTGSDGPC